jgi:hypothetical protein
MQERFHFVEALFQFRSPRKFFPLPALISGLPEISI